MGAEGTYVFELASFALLLGLGLCLQYRADVTGLVERERAKREEVFARRAAWPLLEAPALLHRFDRRACRSDGVGGLDGLHPLTGAVADG